MVGETVQLKKAGTTYKGLCPFHGEKTPSFTVTPGREILEVLRLRPGRRHLQLRDAARRRRRSRRRSRSSPRRPASRSTSGRRRDDARKARLRDVLESAIAFYHAVLTGQRPGQPALEYLRGRGFTDETIAKFQLGWAPGGWDTLSPAARRASATSGPTSSSRSGSPSRASRRGGGVYDRFRERVIFPIRDANGGAVGLGGRILGSRRATGTRPKYLNSPATPLFDKSRTLYLIDQAKGPIRKAGQAVIVEGYTDALMAHQAGFDNVVASLGTALTPGPGRAADPLREEDRARLRRRRGRREGRDVRRARRSRR